MRPRGTLFLDEVGDMDFAMQAKILRALQERTVTPVGGRPVRVDVRVLAATHRDLATAARGGAFREDLFYRLNVVPIRVPPLRERMGDLPVLVEYLVTRYAEKAGRRIGRVERRTLERLQDYGWPGNIRELQNVIERAVILCEGDTLSIDEAWLKPDARGRSPRSSPPKGTLGPDRAREREVIEAALTDSRGRVSGPSGAAAKLGIPRQTLESKIASLGIDRHRFRSVRTGDRGGPAL
jgi:formate hydrogenlyase transcriptional activator